MQSICNRRMKHNQFIDGQAAGYRQSTKVISVFRCIADGYFPDLCGKFLWLDFKFLELPLECHLCFWIFPKDTQGCESLPDFLELILPIFFQEIQKAQLRAQEKIIRTTFPLHFAQKWLITV